MATQLKCFPLEGGQKFLPKSIGCLGDGNKNGRLRDQHWGPYRQHFRDPILTTQRALSMNALKNDMAPECFG
jgi:hypothetical protein